PALVVGGITLRQIRGQHIHLRLGLCEGNARIQAGDDAQEAADLRPVMPCCRLLKWRPQLRPLPAGRELADVKIKIPGGNAYNCIGRTTQLNCFSNNVRIGAECRLPQTVAQYYNVALARLILAWQKSAAQHGIYAQ